MRDALYDLVDGVSWDLAPWQQLLVVLALVAVLAAVALGSSMLLACRDLRRQRELDRRIRQRYTIR